MKIDTLADLYLEQIRDLCSCEAQMIKVLPKMAAAAHHPDLRKTFENHLKHTRVHLGRLDQILETLGQPAGSKVCAAAMGLIEESQEVLDNQGDEAARDAGLICAAQKMEHYEIASYGCLRTYARALGRDEDAGLLEESLKEEKEADVALTTLAMSVINDAAMA